MSSQENSVIEITFVRTADRVRTRVSVIVKFGDQSFVDTLNVASEMSRTRFLNKAQQRLNCDRLELEQALESAALSLTEDSERQRTDGAPIDSHRLADSILANDFTESGIPTLRFWNDQFYQWRTTHWGAMSKGRVEAEVALILSEEFSDLAQDGVTDNAGFRYNVTTKITKDVMLALKSRVIVGDEIELPAWVDGECEELPDPRMLLPCSNGIVDLTDANAELLRPTPALLNFNGVDYEFDPTADCPQWRAFLDQIWPEDEECIQTLQEFMGHCLIPLTRFQKILCMIGPPRSGKGTITRVLTALVGKGNVCSPMIRSLSNDFGLQPLLGKLVAIINDARIPRRGTHGLVETLLTLSGEDSVTVNRKGVAQIDVRLSTRLILVSNEIPEFPDASCALPNRFLILPFSKSWANQEDTTLTDRLLMELPGILNWAIEGLRRLLNRNRFVQPEAARDQVESMRRLSSPIGAFLEDLCEVAPHRRVAKNELFEAYKLWCAVHNIFCPRNSVFGRDLHTAIPGIGTSQPRPPRTDAEPPPQPGINASRRPSHPRQAYYTGVGLKSHWQGQLPDRGRRSESDLSELIEALNPALAGVAEAIRSLKDNDDD